MVRRRPALSARPSQDAPEVNQIDRTIYRRFNKQADIEMKMHRDVFVKDNAAMANTPAIDVKQKSQCPSNGVPEFSSNPVAGPVDAAEYGPTVAPCCCGTP